MSYQPETTALRTYLFAICVSSCFLTTFITGLFIILIEMPYSFTAKCDLTFSIEFVYLAYQHHIEGSSSHTYTQEPLKIQLSFWGMYLDWFCRM